MDDKQIFTVYYSCIVSLARHHPGSGTRGHERPSLLECAKEAAEMVDYTNQLFPPFVKEEDR
jgi:hypothetical protein